jgi:hypothetical protein
MPQMEITHKQVYFAPKLGRSPIIHWAVLFAKTANAIGLLPEKRDTGNLQATGIDIPICCAIIRISVDQHLTMIALIAASS